MEFITEVNNLIAPVANGRSRFAAQFHDPTYGEEDESILRACKIADGIEQYYGIDVCRRLNGKENNENAIRSLVKHVISADCNQTLVDVFNSGFAVEARKTAVDINANCVITYERDQEDISLRDINPILIPTLPFFHNFGEEDRFEFVMADLTLGDVQGEDSFEEIHFGKVIKWLKIYDTDASTKIGDTNETVLENIPSYTKQYSDIKRDKASVDRTQKVTMLNCNTKIRRFGAVFSMKPTTFETCGIALCTSMLEVNGTAVVMIKNPILSSTSNANLGIRRVLVECFDVKEIIQVNSKISAIVFCAVEDSEPKLVKDSRVQGEVKTKEVVFSEIENDLFKADTFKDSITNEFVDLETLRAKKKLGESEITELDENKFIVLAGVKGQIKSSQVVTKSTVDVETIMNNNFILSRNFYNVKHIVANENYKLYPIERCNCLVLSGPHSDEYGRSEGEYPFFTKTQEMSCDEADFPDGGILIRSEGDIEYHDQGFSCSADCVVITSPEIWILLFILLSQEETILFNRKISESSIKKVQIPLPMTEDRIQYWVDKLVPIYKKDTKHSAKFKKAIGEFKKENSI